MRPARILGSALAATILISGATVFTQSNQVAASSAGDTSATGSLVPLALVCSGAVNGLTVANAVAYTTTSACTVNGGLTVASGGAFTAGPGTTINGGVSVESGGTFTALAGSTIHGAVTVASGATYIHP